MFPPLTKVLIKIFAAGFYKVHAGMLLTLFVSFFIYFFFTSVLNQTHLTQDEIVLYNLKLAISSVSNPIVMGLLFFIWLLYTIKSCKYVSGQLLVTEHYFLFYSSNSFSKTQQFKSWLIVQLVIAIPIIALGVFAVVIGVIFDYYLIPVIIPFYLFLLGCASALYDTYLVNRPIDAETKSYGFKMTKNWRKPLFSLFLYHILDKMKITYAITKIISGLMIAYIYMLFPGDNEDLRVPAVLMLAVITTHAVLIFQSHEFERTYLRFSRNFPYERWKLYMNFTGLYMLLILPEIIWLFTAYHLLAIFQMILFGVSFALLFRSVLYKYQNMNNYIPLIFCLFILSTIFILFGMLWLVVILNIIFSFVLFYRNYYTSMLG